MRLVREISLSAWERQHACPVDEALEHIQQALNERLPIEGLEELRAGLMIDIDSQVLEQVEHGEWWLIRADADYGNRIAPTQALVTRPLEPVEAVQTPPRIFRLVDSLLGEPQPDRQYLANVDGSTAERKTDALGIAHLFLSTEARRIALRIIGT